jgi:hypothetical protein
MSEQLYTTRNDRRLMVEIWYPATDAYNGKDLNEASGRGGDGSGRCDDYGEAHLFMLKQTRNVITSLTC